MKKRNKYAAAFIAAAVTMTQASLVNASMAPDGKSDAQTMYGDAYTSWKSEKWDNGLSSDWTQVSLTPGEDETSINLAWYSKNTDTVSLVYGKNADLSDGKTVEVSTNETGQVDKNGIAYNSNKATISGLSPKTTYYYKVGQKDIKSFETGDTDSFRFAFAGDPQIGSSNELKGSDTAEFYTAQSNAVANDSYSWSETLSKIKSAGTDFIVSAGDQIQSTKKKSPNKSSTVSEIEYAGYLSPDVLTSLPVATTVGNHDADNENYKYHFNVPNLSGLGDNGKVGGDYYFVYNNVLFIMLNTQDTNSAEHIRFIEETVAKNTDCKWKVVTLHQDIYGSAEHSNEPEIINLRYALTPAFEKNGIDVVLTGHDHAYSRSKFLSGGETQKTISYTDDEFDKALKTDAEYSGDGTLYVAPGNIKDDTTDEEQKEYLTYLGTVMDAERVTEEGEYVVDPKGILYLTASSSSGSKYYDLVPRKQTYIANRWQEDVPTYSLIDVTETTFTINTYRTDNDEAIDNTVTIVKSADKTEMDAKKDKIKAELADGTLTEKDYTEESWKALTDALAQADNISAEASQAAVNEILEKLSAARAGLVKNTPDTDENDEKNSEVANEDDKSKAADDNKGTDDSDTSDDKSAAGNINVADSKDADSQKEESTEVIQDTKDNGNNSQSKQNPQNEKSDKQGTKSTDKVNGGDGSQVIFWTVMCIGGMCFIVGAAILISRKREEK